MDCPDCGAQTVAFAVPEDLQEYAPGPAAALCTRCLRTHAADAADVPDGDPEFSAVADAFPSGRGGVALALALGKLGSLALERPAIVALCEDAERAGADPALTLVRLESAPGVDPHFDLPRRREQLESMR